MRRSGWVTGVIVMQFLFGVSLSSICIFLLSLIRLPEWELGPHAAATIWGLKVAAGILGPFAGAALVGPSGIWKNMLWGWWTAFLTDIGLFGVLLYSVIDGGWKNPDFDMVGLAAISVVLPVLLLLPTVRRFFWRSDSVPSLATTVGTPSA